MAEDKIKWESPVAEAAYNKQQRDKKLLSMLGNFVTLSALAGGSVAGVKFLWERLIKPETLKSKIRMSEPFIEPLTTKQSEDSGSDGLWDRITGASPPKFISEDYRTFPLAALGLTVPAYLSYKGTKYLLDRIRRAELESTLEEARQEFREAAKKPEEDDEETVKQSDWDWPHLGFATGGYLTLAAAIWYLSHKYFSTGKLRSIDPEAEKYKKLENYFKLQRGMGSNPVFFLPKPKEKTNKVEKPGTELPTAVKEEEDDEERDTKTAGISQSILEEKITPEKFQSGLLDSASKLTSQDGGNAAKTLMGMSPTKKEPTDFRTGVESGVKDTLQQSLQSVPIGQMVSNINPITKLLFGGR